MTDSATGAPQTLALVIATAERLRSGVPASRHWRRLVSAAHLRLI